MELPEKGVIGGAHTRQAAPFRAGDLNEVVHVLSVHQAQVCWRNCTGVPGSFPEKGTTPGGDAGSRRPWRGNSRDCVQGCSYFANIPRKEEISDRCS